MPRSFRSIAGRGHTSLPTFTGDANPKSSRCRPLTADGRTHVRVRAPAPGVLRAPGEGCRLRSRADRRPRRQGRQGLRRAVAPVPGRGAVRSGAARPEAPRRNLAEGHGRVWLASASATSTQRPSVSRAGSTAFSLAEGRSILAMRDRPTGPRMRHHVDESMVQAKKADRHARPAGGRSDDLCRTRWTCVDWYIL